MRIVLIGVSHWHVPFYLDPCLALPGVAVVGVSDAAIDRAEPIATQAGCPAFADYREMCARLRPDFAFALGRHCDMAELGRFLIEARIPFAMEKPCGIALAEVADLAERARAAGVFAAIPFVFRYCALVDAVRELAAGEALQYLSFKFIGGLVERYREARCDWMLDRATAGGGPLINLGVHFLDLCRVLLPGVQLDVAGAVMSNANAGLSIEDHAVVTLRGGGATCLVETGYLYPAPHSVFDLHYSIRTSGHYFAARDATLLEISDNARHRTTREMVLINAPLYPTFVADSLRRLELGEAPIANLDDMAEAMRLVEAAYAASPL
ncbi:MAG TPA: Gfo/Idh/MocA family oxidoreductase [Acetobacteraceae bacterium]|jgi:predicted dehydrogenase|nr:Gfo/Idh/MocA family oxidoreductase [Acetobacteraceae bacterium]